MAERENRYKIRTADFCGSFYIALPLCTYKKSVQTEEDSKGAEPLIVFFKIISINDTSPLCTYYNFVQTKEDSKEVSSLVVLGVGVYRGGGIETPAPIRLLWLLSLRKESNEEKSKRVYLL
jgi:hypothetical protein